MSNERTIVISDVHGCYDELTQLLERCCYHPSMDQLILLGDYVDRGPMSKQTIGYVIQLVKGGAIALRGNHDQMFLDFINSDDRQVAQQYIANGGLSTLNTYVTEQQFEEGLTMESLLSIKQYIRNYDKQHLTF